MSRDVLVAGEVAAQLGAEQVARLRGPEWARPVQCWECDRWIAAAEAAAVLLLRVPELAHPDTGGGASFAVHSHPACRPSQVLQLSLAEIEARRAGQPAAAAGAEDADSVDVVATVFDTGHGTAFPVVMVSYRADLMADQPGPDRVDLLTTAMLGRGWQPITTLAEPPGPGPEGWRVRFTHTEARAGAAGVLEILDPSGGAETIADVRVGKTVLLQGSQFLTDWARSGRAGVKRAMRAGLLTGGVVPVELDGPCNADPSGAGAGWRAVRIGYARGQHPRDQRRRGAVHVLSPTVAGAVGRLDDPSTSPRLNTSHCPR